MVRSDRSPLGGKFARRGRLAAVLVAVCAGNLVIAATVANAETPSANSASKRRCSSSDPIYSLSASNVSCRTARRIARAVARGNRNPLKFRCRSAVNGPESLRYRCTRGERSVRFILRTPG